MRNPLLDPRPGDIVQSKLNGKHYARRVIDVKLGDTVTVGQQIATLDTEDLTRTLHERQATLATAELNMSKALNGEAVASTAGSSGSGGSASKVASAATSAAATTAILAAAEGVRTNAQATSTGASAAVGAASASTSTTSSSASNSPELVAARHTPRQLPARRSAEERLRRESPPAPVDRRTARAER